MPPYAVAVRTLCEFGAKQGDLDARFTPSPSAHEGIEGHALVAARRGASYRAEVALSGRYGPLLVRGRADGFDPAGPRLEEVKTFRGELERMPQNHRHLHWAQAKVYGWLMCEQEGLRDIGLALVYLDIDTLQETVLAQRCAAPELKLHFERLCGAFVQWAAQEQRHRTARDAGLSALAFPHAGFRRGQRALAEAVYKAARAGRCLLAQAPTGIGKTVGTLFPLLKAMPVERLDRLFFLTAKTSGRSLALEALAALGARLSVAPSSVGAGDSSVYAAGEESRVDEAARPPVPPLRILELVARDKACEHPDKACHGESCPLARGFFDRLPQARAAAPALPVWDKAAVRDLALRHDLCPYYLAQELAHWSDVVVGDYNHFFDASAMLYALTVAHEWHVGVLVDEAHNLVERGREMYSATLGQAALKSLRRAAPAALKKPLDRVNRRWNELSREHPGGYRVLDRPPTKLLAALQQAAAAIADHLAQDPAQTNRELMDLYFDALRLGRLAESFGDHSFFDLTAAQARGSVLCLRNVVPAPFLQRRLAAAGTMTLFSATLQPARFYRHMLGLADDTPWIDIDSPFDVRQLQVNIARGISTRFQHRAASLERVVDVIARQFRDRHGNYLAFFSSHDYLQQAAACFEQRHPDVPCWRQARGMSEAEQCAFLARFVEGGQGVGFAVLGGSFAEGIDLPGERLVGAFIATLGMPAISDVNEQMRQHIDRLCGAGFDYVYLYPGLRKVVQAAGRVIRTVSDRGVVHLIDDRFMRRDVRELLPRWWRLQPGASPTLL